MTSACALWGCRVGVPEAQKVGQQWWTLAKCMTLAKNLLLKGGGGIFCIYLDTRPCGLWEESFLFNPCCRLLMFLRVLLFTFLFPKQMVLRQSLLRYTFH